MKARVTVTVDEDRLGALDAICRTRHISRSHAFDEAMVLWEHQRREQELEAGYAAMRDENLAVADEALPAWAETEQRS